MRQKNDETAADFPPVAARHAFEFLGDIFEIEAFCLAAPRALCLILQPGDKIVFIGGRVPGSCHRHSSSSQASRSNALISLGARSPSIRRSPARQLRRLHRTSSASWGSAL